MLFNDGGKEKLGGISDVQMQTTLATALSSSNEALAHSGINLEFSLVHVGLVRAKSYAESCSFCSNHTLAVTIRCPERLRGIFPAFRRYRYLLNMSTEGLEL